jgi:hypothetical protein
MENVVQASAGRKLEAVADIIDDGRDAVRPIEPGSQLAFGDPWREAEARCRRHSQT